MRRIKSRELTSVERQSLVAEYNSYPLDQLVSDRHTAARTGYSRSRIISLRISGKGPKYQKNGTGTIRYRKADVEAWMSAGFKEHAKTSEYPSRIRALAAA
jgi:predicted DNA-binding transcriptional regulator AlpA